MAQYDVGGQAVMGGVMMKSPDKIAIAVRKPNGKIELRTKPVSKPHLKYPFLKWPIIRGIVSFGQMMYLGMKTLTESAEMAGQEFDEPSKFEKKLAKIIGKDANDIMMFVAVVLALTLSIGLFFVIPTLLESFIRWLMVRGTDNTINGFQEVIINVLGGITRISIFVIYIYLVSRLKEIKQVFMYHGSEHKSIHCLEKGLELTVENVQKQTTIHPRCGTSFLVIVMVISIIVFMFFGSKNSGPVMRILSRLALLPFVAGISYEVLKYLAKAKENPIINALKWPGMMLQKLTTAQPDDSMVEVAIVSLRAALGMENPIGTFNDEKMTAEDISVGKVLES